MARTFSLVKLLPSKALKFLPNIAMCIQPNNINQSISLSYYCKNPNRSFTKVTNILKYQEYNEPSRKIIASHQPLCSSCCTLLFIVFVLLRPTSSPTPYVEPPYQQFRVYNLLQIQPDTPYNYPSRQDSPLIDLPRAINCSLPPVRRQKSVSEGQYGSKSK